MAFLLAVANQKGGSGKTTTCMNLAGGLSRAEYPTLVVDADPQQSALAWASLAAVQREDPAAPLSASPPPPPSIPFRVGTAAQILGTDGPSGFARIAHMHAYEAVVVDCPPGVVDSRDAAGLAARSAIYWADAIVVPLRPSTLDFSSTLAFAGYLAAHTRDGQRILVLLNGIQPRTVLGRDAPAQAAHLFAAIPNARVLSSSIGFRAVIAEVCGSGKTIFDYAPGSQAAREYAQLTQEVLSCLTAPLSSPSPALATS